MQFDDIQQQAFIDLARFIAPNHFDYRGHTPAAYSEIAEPLVRQRMGLTNRELCAAKALALWAQFERIELSAFALLASDSGDTPKIMTEEEGLRIDALRHNVCKAAHDYAKQVGDALLIEAWPAPDWKPNADTQPPGVTLKAAQSQPDSITSRQVATLFDGLPYTAENWPKRLSDTKWLQSAAIARGEVGGITGVWCPLTLAQLIHERAKGRVKQKTLETLNRQFKRNPALKPWCDAWNEHYALFTDAIDD